MTASYEHAEKIPRPSNGANTNGKAKPSPEPLPFITTADIAAPLEPRRFPIRGLAMAPGAVTLILAYSYSGKTLVIQDLELAVSTGGLAWGEFRCEPGRVVHVDYEQGRYETIDRFQRLARGRGIDLVRDAGDRLQALVLPPFYLNTPGVADTYKRAAEGAAMLVVDTLAAASPGEDENDTRIAAGLYMLGEVSEATGAIVVVAHHLGKAALARDADKADPRTAARGSSAIFSAASYAYLITGEAKAPKKVSQIKGRSLGDPPTEDFYLRFEPVRCEGFHNPTNPADGGGFRISYLTEEQVNPPEKAEQEHEAAIAADLERIVNAVRKEGPAGVAGADAVARLARLNAQRGRAAVRIALDRGLIANVAKKPNGELDERRPRYALPSCSSSSSPPKGVGTSGRVERPRPDEYGTSRDERTSSAIRWACPCGSIAPDLDELCPECGAPCPPERAA